MRVFISFDWDDRDQVNGFRGMLANPDVRSLEHRDKSIRHDYSEYGASEIKRQIERKIKQSDITVCLISQRTQHSKWVNWELETSRRLGKPVVGVVLKNQPVGQSIYPEFFRRYPQFEVYGWDEPSRINAALQKAYRDQRAYS